MNKKQIATLVTILILSTIISAASYNIAWSKPDKDNDYCYDEVGDGHPCFDTKKECRDDQKKDEIAESPCYNEDSEY